MSLATPHLGLASPVPSAARRHAAWVLDAGNPYLEWLIGGRDRALATVGDWLQRGSSELSARRITAAFDGDDLVGGYLALDGHEVASARKADLMWLLRATPREEREALRERLERSRATFPPVDESHRYLSKIAVVPSRRGQGLGAALLDAFIRCAFDQGHDCLRLDVCRANEPAFELYRSRGFAVIGETELAPLGVGYLAMTLSRSAHE